MNYLLFSTGMVEEGTYELCSRTNRYPIVPGISISVRVNIVHAPEQCAAKSECSIEITESPHFFPVEEAYCEKYNLISASFS